MLEEQIRQIVRAVLDQVQEGGGQQGQLATGAKEQLATEVKPAPESARQAPKANTYAPGDTGDDNDLEDLAAVDLQKEILVPCPADRAALEYFKQTTPARIGVWRSGPRPLTRTLLRFRADHAIAQDAVFKEVSEEILSGFNLVRVQTLVEDKDQYLTRPDLGSRLSGPELEKIRRECPRRPQVQIVIADGLSSKAVEANLADILPALKQGLQVHNLQPGREVFVKFGRVDVMKPIGMTLEAEVVVLLVGERPGLGTSASMSAYLVYKPGPDTVVADYTVVSNIHNGGTPPAEAGAHLADVVKKIYTAKASGVKLAMNQ